MSKQKGFSLIELLIVVAIILVIAAIAIPNLVRSRISANEAAAVAAMRTVNTSQVAFAVMNPAVGYADDLSKLGTTGLLDWVLGCATQPCPKQGYKFWIANPSGNPVVNFNVYAVPVTVGTTGIRGFCADQLNHVTVDPAGATNCTKDL